MFVAVLHTDILHSAHVLHSSSMRTGGVVRFVEWCSIFRVPVAGTIRPRHSAIGDLHVVMVISKPRGPVRQTGDYLWATIMIAGGGEVPFGLWWFSRLFLPHRRIPCNY